MKKNYFFLLIALVCFAGKSLGQVTEPCGTDQRYRELKKQFPQVEVYEKLQEANIKAYLQAHPYKGVGAKTTAAHNDTDYYNIPVVVHIMHNYGSEVVPDNSVYKLIDEMNKFYSAQNDLSGIIAPFKPYIGKAKIRFYLATTDPAGRPTNGITHRRTYLTYGGDDQAKMDLWPPTSYYNIWFENVIGRSIGSGIVLAYATFPTFAAIYPYNDGVICRADRILDGSTIDHETGHYFTLYHPWNSSSADVGVACGDDEVDDTPPTKGHFSVCGSGELADTICSKNYFKVYSDILGHDSLVNYPDTANTQNVMDYSDCSYTMLTRLQVSRMRACLNSEVGGRNNLWTLANLFTTGVGSYDTFTNVLTPTARYDLKVNPEFAAFSASNVNGMNAATYSRLMGYFTFPGTNVYFHNRSWNDTVTDVKWEFSNGAANPTVSFTGSSISNAVANNFTDPGWVNVKLTATGNHTGDTTAEWPRGVFVADVDGTQGMGYYQEFADADTAKWPMFNYYNNEFKWQHANVGYYDNNSVMYTGFDHRYDPFIGRFAPTGTPRGDFDDLFSVPFNLSDFGSGPCSFNFYYSAASRSSLSYNINDTLFIEYSANKGAWVTLASLTKSTLCNKGAVGTDYVPTSSADWAMFSMNLPTAARTAYTTFRFRYKPGVEWAFDGTTYSPGTLSSGNNLYIDRINISPYPAGVDAVNMGKIDVLVAPNPTSGDAYVIVKDVNNTTAQVAVMDITGKVVYTTSQQVAGGEARITIPKAAISVPGMYMVQTITGNQSTTKKLVVE